MLWGEANGKPRFGRSLTLPGASPYLRRSCRERANFKRSPCVEWREKSKVPEQSLMFLKAYRVTRNNCMRTRKKFPIRLAAGLLLAILFDTAVQLVWKSAVLSLPNNGSPWLNVQALLHSPLALSVLCLMVCQFFNWLTVLSNADLSYAQPVTSLSYVSVFCLSVLYFKEATDLIQIAGIIFVLAGVWFISQTDHVTPSKEREA